MMFWLKGQTLPLRFGQFRHASSTTSLSTETLRGAAVIKTLKHNSPFPLTQPKKPKPKIPKTPKPKIPKKSKPKLPKKNKIQKTKKTKTTIISELFQNVARNMHRWKSSEIMFFFNFLVFSVLVFLVFLVLFFLIFLVLVFWLCQGKGVVLF